MRAHATLLSLATVGVLMTASPATAAPPWKPDANAARSAIPAEHTWSLSALFTDDAAFEAALAQQGKDMERLRAYAGKLADPATLAECLALYFDLRVSTNRLTLYAALRYDTAQRSDAAKALSDRAQTALHELMAGAGFIRQELLALPDGKVEEALASTPALAPFRGFVDEVRRRRGHVLGPEGEKLLSLAGDNLWAEIDLNEIPSDHEKTFGAMLSSVPLPVIQDEEGKDVQLTLSNYSRYRSSKDRKVRAAAVEALFSSLNAYRDVFAATFAGQARFSVFLARARGYDTVLDAYLDKDGIDPAVYRNLIAAVRANLAPLHRYVKIRKLALGLDTVRLCDLYPPLVPAVELHYTWDEGREAVLEALAPLGDEALSVLRTAVDPKSRWIDVYPHKDKDSGAFAASMYGVHPFVKMNWLDDLDSVSTLAHELGHLLHSHLAMSHQPVATWSYVPFVAEIASTINEKMLSDWLLDHAKDDTERLYLLSELAEMVRGTIYRQTLFAEFELLVHEAAEAGTPITAELLADTYARLVKEYYGPDFELGPNDGMEWAYIGHFYYKYYMFTYATGLSSGIALAERIRTMGAPARDAFLGMLAGGSSKPPLDLLRDAGVDLTKPEAVEAATRLLDETLGKMEVLLAKRSRVKADTRKR